MNRQISRFHAAHIAALLLGVLGFLPSTSFAAGIGGSDPQAHLITVVEPEVQMDATSATAFGDDYDPGTGQITFSALDISIPGNSAIPVELRRWVPSDDYRTGGPTGWAWNIPFIRGNYAAMRPGHSPINWNFGTGGWYTGHNCSGYGTTAQKTNGDLVSTGNFWTGKLLHIPGVTSENFQRDVTTYGQMTKSNFKITSCTTLPSGQEGIVVSGPNGLTYTFNEVRSYYNGKIALKDPVVWTRVLLVTRIADRFGNFVDYTYTGGDLTRILASDGREIVINYETVSVSRPVTAVANDKTWTYSYQSSGARYLSTVTRPDGRSWSYSGLQTLLFDPDGQSGKYQQQYRVAAGSTPVIPNCIVGSSGPETAIVTHPDGLTVTYTLQNRRHTRSQVNPNFYSPSGEDYTIARNLNCAVHKSLIQRTISGPGLTPTSWTYTYSTNQGNFTTAALNTYFPGPYDLPVPVGGYPSFINGTNASEYRSVTISSPTEVRLLYIHRRYTTITENMVVAEDVLNAVGNTLLRRTEKSFSQGVMVGSHGLGTGPNGNQRNYRINPSQTLVRDYLSGGTDIFTTAWSNYDTFGFAQTTQESNNVGGATKTTQTGYLHDTSLWLIGLTTTSSINGIASVQNNYFANRLLQQVLEFGAVKSNYTYNADGTLATSFDALNNTTTYSLWYRGLPTYQYLPGGGVATRNTNWDGTLAIYTDPNGNPTGYGYNGVGRVTSIDLPGSWTDKSITYDFSGGELGSPAGATRQRLTHGRFEKTTYFDALLRPVLIEERDSATGSAKYVRTTYNQQGLVSFESYPSSSYVASTGITSTYDALGRVVQRQASGPVTLETRSYLSGNRISVTDADGHTTTVTYDASGSPTYDGAVAIASPEGQSTSIARDVFGKVTSVTQYGSWSGGYSSATRIFEYDGAQRICRRTDPEAGSTVWGYDAASRTAWEAKGQSGSGCVAQPSGATTYTYDAKGRRTGDDYPGSADDVAYIYDHASNLRHVNNPSAQREYTYNSLNLVESERAIVDGVPFDLAFAYSPLGHLSSRTTLSRTVSYSPDAWGRPTQLGSYVTSISYHPNDLPSNYGLLYGGAPNGIVFSQTLDARQRPYQQEYLATNGPIQKFQYAYTNGGDLTSIGDLSVGTYGANNMSATYDGLHRLRESSGLWGTYTYTYDSLNNVRARTPLPGYLGGLTYSYDALNRLVGVSGSVSRAYSYQSSGEISGDGARTFSINNIGQITGVTGSASAVYAYDGNARRIKATVGGTTEYSMYSKDGLLAYTWNGTYWTDFLSLNGQPLVEIKRTLGVDDVTYLLPDLVGSPRTRVLSAGYDTEHFDPYGEKLNGVSEKIGYTGHAWDAETNLTYMEARFYDPKIGRFLSTDPVHFSDTDPFTFNRYTYANNNPYKFTDPDGRQPIGQFLRNSPLGSAWGGAGQAKAAATNAVAGAASAAAREIKDRSSIKVEAYAAAIATVSVEVKADARTLQDKTVEGSVNIGESNTVGAGVRVAAEFRVAGPKDVGTVAGAAEFTAGPFGIEITAGSEGTNVTVSVGRTLEANVIKGKKSASAGTEVSGRISLETGKVVD